MIAVAALVALAFVSIGGGKMLVDDPSGRSMGIEFMIPHLPLNLQDFFWVGIWLVVVYGVLPLIMAAGLWFGKKWAWSGSLGLGVVVVTWILAEVYLFYAFGFVFFYPLIGGIGLLIIILLSFSATRRYCKG